MSASETKGTALIADAASTVRVASATQNVPAAPWHRLGTGGAPTSASQTQASRRCEKRANRPLDAFPVESAGRERRAGVAAQDRCRAGPREARIRIALLRWSPFGRARVPWPVLL
jgi:hypothetical protein